MKSFWRRLEETAVIVPFVMDHLLGNFESHSHEVIHKKSLSGIKLITVRYGQLKYK